MYMPDFSNHFHSTGLEHERIDPVLMLMLPCEYLSPVLILLLLDLEDILELLHPGSFSVDDRSKPFGKF